MSNTGKNKEKEILFSDMCWQIAFELIEKDYFPISNTTLYLLSSWKSTDCSMKLTVLLICFNKII